MTYFILYADPERGVPRNNFWEQNKFINCWFWIVILCVCNTVKLAGLNLNVKLFKIMEFYNIWISAIGYSSL